MVVQKEATYFRILPETQLAGMNNRGRINMDYLVLEGDMGHCIHRMDAYARNQTVHHHP